MNPTSNLKKYSTEIIAFVVLIVMATILMTFVALRDHSGIRKYCPTAETCVSPDYPGKVEK